MDDNRCQLFGLLGFIVAGFIFVAAGIKFGDPLTISGSVVWIASCVVWLIPLVRPKKD